VTRDPAVTPRPATDDAAARPGAPARPRPLAPLVENVIQSATACLIAMTQGNLLTLTLTHWLIASRTGLLSGAIATAALWLAGERRRWVMAALLAVATVGADYFSHPSHFGGVLGEAIVTGLAAGALSLIAGRVWRTVRPSRGGSASSAEASYRG
jgi:hypothetical protein